MSSSSLWLIPMFKLTSIKYLQACQTDNIIIVTSHYQFFYCTVISQIFCSEINYSHTDGPYEVGWPKKSWFSKFLGFYKSEITQPRNTGKSYFLKFLDSTISWSHRARPKILIYSESVDIRERENIAHTSNFENHLFLSHPNTHRDI